MPHVDIKCAECGAKLKVLDNLVGTSIKCPKCKETFIAEVGETYGLAETPAPPRPITRDDPNASPPDQRRPAKQSKGPKTESKAEREQRERMEKWARQMEAEK